MKLYSITTLLIASLFIVSCNNDDTTDDGAVAGTVTLDLDHIWGPDQMPFLMNTELIHPMLGEDLTIETFRYYISNVKLQSTTGDWVILPESYYLVDASQSTIMDLPDIPGGTYTAIQMTYGVDSLRNVSGAQSGALSPSQGMFWSWNTGYIMLKAEGTSTASLDGTFAFHLGGFTGEYAVPLTRTFDFGGQALRVDGDATAEIHLIGNIARLWHGAESLADRSKQHMPGATAQTMSHNFYDSFVFDHIHN